MAFEQEPTRIPVAVGAITITLLDRPAGEFAAKQSAAYDIKIELSDGEIATRRGNLVPHITAAQQQGLLDFMADLRTQAEQEIL